MTDTATRPRRLAWLVPLVVNATFGWLAVLPLSLVWYFLANYPLATLGLTERDPTDNDGILPHLIVLAGVAVFLALWAAVNYLARAGTRLPARPYWLVSAVVLLAPSLLVRLSPAVKSLWPLA